MVVVSLLLLLLLLFVSSFGLWVRTVTGSRSLEKEGVRRLTHKKDISTPKHRTIEMMEVHMATFPPGGRRRALVLLL